MRTRLILLILLAFGLAACGPTVVTMKPLSEFPAPLVEPLPVTVGVHYPPAFADYSHKEKRPGPAGEEWTIALGAPQVQVFRTVFGASFRDVVELGTQKAGDSHVSAVIVPSVTDFQFALPDDTKGKVFEIWIKYDIGIHDAAGAEIGHWIFTAYGKTPTAFLTTDADAIHAATVVALRDAGASMVSGLQRDARIREWLGVQ